MEVIKFLFVLLFLYTWNCVACAQREGLQPVFIRVDENGDVWVNNIKILKRKGVDAPAELITLEGVNPDPINGGDRYVWHVFKKIGLFFERRNDPESDGMNITLPANEDLEFPGLVYRGSFSVGNAKIDFDANQKITKEQIVKTMNRDGKATWMTTATMSLYQGRTTLYFRFDEINMLKMVTISVPNSRK